MWIPSARPPMSRSHGHLTGLSPRDWFSEMLRLGSFCCHAVVHGLHSLGAFDLAWLGAASVVRVREVTDPNCQCAGQPALDCVDVPRGPDLHHGPGLRWPPRASWALRRPRGSPGRGGMPTSRFCELVGIRNAPTDGGRPSNAPGSGWAPGRARPAPTGPWCVRSRESIRRGDTARCGRWPACGHPAMVSTVLRIVDDEKLLLKPDHQRERREWSNTEAFDAAPMGPNQVCWVLWQPWAGSVAGAQAKSEVRYEGDCCDTRGDRPSARSSCGSFKSVRNGPKMDAGPRGRSLAKCEDVCAVSVAVGREGEVVPVRRARDEPSDHLLLLWPGVERRWTAPSVLVATPLFACDSKPKSASDTRGSSSSSP